ncbi:DUF2147 domain-containing protein [Acinetobacter sp. ANC 3832]|uniref:DUF2147 domain-containing protein n=1 Tax=Acinetobacter sp. ANC 3832 TaxID=1977874 RepID=UPI000A330ED9|nr:DUF2147 domain-containing protein [Acinetobacter sp. ANC 3832]OTG89885.1 signal peptidase [Acinetobacter sp. ANC 3832]
MKNKIKLIYTCLLFSLGTAIHAQDISGLWQSVDDKTGAPKGQVELKRDKNGVYTGTIVKVTPRMGYHPKEICSDCPAPYTNKPIIGIQAITGLKHVEGNDYADGKILDPNSGKIYSLKAKLSTNGKRLQLRGYIGIAMLGRSQTWIRIE